LWDAVNAPSDFSLIMLCVNDILRKHDWKVPHCLTVFYLKVPFSVSVFLWERTLASLVKLSATVTPGRIYCSIFKLILLFSWSDT
jgi:hypothetical protein